jgi:hypothetical protein
VIVLSVMANVAKYSKIPAPVAKLGSVTVFWLIVQWRTVSMLKSEIPPPS